MDLVLVVLKDEIGLLFTQNLACGGTFASSHHCPDRFDSPSTDCYGFSGLYFIFAVKFPQTCLTAVRYSCKTQKRQVFDYT
jgi:hypothetical protein